MPDWDYDAFADDEDALSSLDSLRGILSLLGEIADELAPDLVLGRHEDSHADIDRELLRRLGDRVYPILEISDQIYHYVDALNHILEDPDLKDGSSPRKAEPQMFEPAQIFVGRKLIHLGVVDRYFVYPTSPRLSDRLLYRVVKIPDMDDLLVREQHDVFGWHYHYCDRAKRRSDVLMSFDRSRVRKAHRVPNRLLHPLCWELHAIKKAKFNAKPWL